MKEIGKQKFGLLYDKLSDYLQQTGGRIEGCGIEIGITHKTLSKLWEEGKTWETITLIIAYHYSRTDTLLLRYSEISTIIRQGASIGEIQKLLGIKGMTEIEDKVMIGRDEFEDEFGKLWGLVREKKTIKDILKGLNLPDQTLLNGLWKQGRKWETVTAILVFLRLSYFKAIEIDTEFGEFEFRKNQTGYQIIETLQNAVPKA